MSIVNPFQQINANLPQLAPAPLSPGFDPAQLGDSAPPQMPQSKRPQVFGPTPQDRQETVEGGKLEKDYQADLHPWGSPENHPGTGGKVGHVFSQIGNTLGDILAPKVMARIPGTQAYRQQEENGLEDRLNKLAQLQSQLGEQGALTSHLKEETAEMPGKAESEEGFQGAQVRHLNDESEGLENPQPSFSIHDTEDGPLFVNNATGTAQHLTADGVPVGPKIKLTQSPTIIGEDKKPHTYMLDDKGAKVVDLGVYYEKPSTVNVNAGNAEMDREATRLGKPYEKGIADASAQLEKIADARAMVNGNAESQALGIPKVLTALVSGQGSGIRITQAELNMIGKARGIAGDVEGTLNKWAGQGSLSKVQQQQLTQILDDVKARLEKKAAVHSAALDAINGAGSREEVIQADKQARKQLQQIEKYGHYEGEEVTVKGQPIAIKKIHPDGSFE